jgi:hypothetical protein
MRLYTQREDELCTTMHFTAIGEVFQSPSCVRLACQHGLQALFASRKLQERAGLNADVPTLIAAQEFGLQVTTTYINAAAGNGRLAVLQLLHIDQGVELPADISNYAAASASMNVLRWLKQVGAAFNAGTTQCAAASGHVYVLQHLHDEACPWDARSCKAAALNGQLEALRCLRANGCPWADDISCTAASSGSVPMMIWLGEEGAVITARTLINAAYSGHIALCEHLRAEGVPWAAAIATATIYLGHTEALQWVLEQGCPTDTSRMCWLAARYGHVSILSLFKTQRLLPAAQQLSPSLQAAGAHGQLAAAQWLMQQGAAWPVILRSSGVQWSGESLAWARAEGCSAPTLV